MNDKGFEAFRLEVLGGEVSRDLSEAGDGDRAEAVPEFEAGRKFFGAEDVERLAAQQDEPLPEDHQLKDALREQNHRYHFEAPDSTDGMTDDELWARSPKPWRKDG